MQTEIVWPRGVLDVLESVRSKDLDRIEHDVEFLRSFPQMYPIKRRGLFRGHRWFPSGEWLVFYRYTGGTVYIRAVWPARIPLPRGKGSIQ